MLEQTATVADSGVATAPSVVVSITLSAASIATALGTLFKVARWIGHTDAMQSQQTVRLDEIRQDVREIRAALLSERS